MTQCAPQRLGSRARRRRCGPCLAETLNAIVEPVGGDSRVPPRDSRCGGVDDFLRLEDRVDVGGDPPLVVRQGDRGATDDEHLSLNALGLQLVA